MLSDNRKFALFEYYIFYGLHYTYEKKIYTEMGENIRNRSWKERMLLYYSQTKLALSLGHASFNSIPFLCLYLDFT